MVRGRRLLAGAGGAGREGDGETGRRGWGRRVLVGCVDNGVQGGTGGGRVQRLALQASLTSTQYAMFERGRLEDGRSEGRVLVEGGRVGWWR